MGVCDIYGSCDIYGAYTLDPSKTTIANIFHIFTNISRAAGHQQVIQNIVISKYTIVSSFIYLIWRHLSEELQFFP